MPPRPRVINRVHAPENDMHAILPLRKKLLNHLQRSSKRCTNSRAHPKTALKQQIRSLPSSSPTLGTLLTSQPPLETRILTLEALRRHPLHVVLPPLSDILPRLPSVHLVPILDRVIRLQCDRDPSTAARTERLARGLGLIISRGAYIKLILSNPKEALLHAHACLAVGHSLNTALLNALLASGITPLRILAEFPRRGLAPNGMTAELVLRRVGLSDSIPPETWAKIAGSVISYVADDNARKGVGLLDVALERGVKIEPHVYDNLVLACVRQGAGEAALRVWREKRRCWMGGLGKRARMAVVKSGLVGLGDPRWNFVVEGVVQREREELETIGSRVADGYTET